MGSTFCPKKQDFHHPSIKPNRANKMVYITNTYKALLRDKSNYLIKRVQLGLMPKCSNNTNISKI